MIIVFTPKLRASVTSLGRLVMGDALGVDGGQVGVFKEEDEVGSDGRVKCGCEIFGWMWMAAKLVSSNRKTRQASVAE